MDTLSCSEHTYQVLAWIDRLSRCTPTEIRRTGSAYREIFADFGYAVASAYLADARVHVPLAGSIRNDTVVTGVADYARRSVAYNRRNCTDQELGDFGSAVFGFFLAFMLKPQLSRLAGFTQSDYDILVSPVKLSLVLFDEFGSI